MRNENDKIHQFTVVCAILNKANDLEVMYLCVNTPVYSCVRHFKQSQWPRGHVFMRKLGLLIDDITALRAALCAHIIICMGAILIYA